MLNKKHTRYNLWRCFYLQKMEYKGAYHARHPTILAFWDAFYELSLEERKNFLQFLSGSTRLPVSPFHFPIKKFPTEIISFKLKKQNYISLFLTSVYSCETISLCFPATAESARQVFGLYFSGSEVSPELDWLTLMFALMICYHRYFGRPHLRWPSISILRRFLQRFPVLLWRNGLIRKLFPRIQLKTKFSGEVC